MKQVGLSGDPFADVGAAVLQQLLKQRPDWTERDAVAAATDWYVREWQGKLHGFFLNSGITNPSNKGKEVERTLEYYGALLADEDTQAKGWCRVSGVYEPLFSAGRENLILGGSGTFLNFHHGLDRGLQVGRTALLHIFFSPLGCLQVGDKAALVHSNKPEVTALLAAKNLLENRKPSRIAVEPGLAKSTLGNPANALFAYVDDVLNEKEGYEAEQEETDTSLTLYHFTNFGAKPEVVLYHLSAAVFEFYREMLSGYKRPWQWFVRAHYRNSKFSGAQAGPDSTALLLPGKAKAAPTAVEPSTYRGWNNAVYLRLLQGQRLLPLMRDWAYRLWRHWPGQPAFPYELTCVYCETLLDMHPETLNLIERLATHVATELDESAIKRTRNHLSTIRTAAELRLLLVRLQRGNYERNAPDALVTLDTFVRYLFPEGTSWREVRDLLLISLYEQLHKQGKHLEPAEGELEDAALADARAASSLEETE